MQCLKAPRTLRKNAQTSGASDCWRNLSIVSRENARACGFLHEVVLCKKHYDVQTNFNKSNCCYPFRSGTCKGTLVRCPHRLIFLKATLELSSARNIYISRYRREDLSAEEIHPSQKGMRNGIKQRAVNFHGKGLPLTLSEFHFSIRCRGRHPLVPLKEKRKSKPSNS